MDKGNLPAVNFDLKRQIILGTRFKLDKKTKPVIFLGTNVSGKLHLGHLVLLSISDYLSKSFKIKIVVSLNEIESVYARNNNLKQVLENRKLIIDFLTKQGILIHSRIEDYDLLLLATRLIKILETDKAKFIKLQSFYSKKLNPSQVFEIVLMAVAPAFVANEQKARDILLVYGADQQNHLEYIYDLYKQAWFKREVKEAFGFSLPKLNYLIIKLIPNLLANSKMSKSKNTSTISFDQIKSDTRLTNEIVEYLNSVIEIMAPLENSTKNSWLNYINTLIF